MALGDGVRRLGAAALQLAHQRVALVALDVEEELLRTGALLAGCLAAALLGTLALGAAGAAVVVFFWDSARLAALLGVTALYTVAAAAIGWRICRALRDKPPFLAATVAELRKDAQRVQGDAP